MDHLTSVENAGADWTLVRCAFFNQNFSETFVALTDDRHIGQLYELSGPRLLTFSEAAAAAAELSTAMTLRPPASGTWRWQTKKSFAQTVRR